MSKFVFYVLWNMWRGTTSWSYSCWFSKAALCATVLAVSLRLIIYCFSQSVWLDDGGEGKKKKQLFLGKGHPPLNPNPHLNFSTWGTRVWGPREQKSFLSATCTSIHHCVGCRPHGSSEDQLAGWAGANAPDAHTRNCLEAEGGAGLG